METIYLAYVAGVASPIVLALTAKAIKRVPQDLKAFLLVISHYIKG